MINSVAMAFYQVNRPDVVMESFGGETVLVQMKSGNYYSLQGSAPLIWDLIDQGSSVEDAGNFLLASHAADEEEVRRSVRNLVEELVAESLIVPVSSAPIPASGKTPAPVEPGTSSCLRCSSAIPTCRNSCFWIPSTTLTNRAGRTVRLRVKAKNGRYSVGGTAA